MSTNPIIDVASQYWHSGRRVKLTPAGWVSGNAICCHHRGHRADTKGRGGIKTTPNSFVYSCFNCQFSTGYTHGQFLSLKFKRWLSWVGLSDSDISKLQLQSLRIREEVDPSLLLEPPLTDIKRDLPPGSVILEPTIHKKAAEYLESRGLDPLGYPYFVTDDTRHQMHRRIIIPYVWNNKLIGYTARAMDKVVRPKYIQSLGHPFVFGQELQKREWTWVPVVEGPIDAISINGCAVLTNAISENQAEQLDALNKTIVIVPDRDKAGMELVLAALEYGWAVSWPQWPDGVKDLNDAVAKFGRVFVLKHIWKTTVKGPTQIQLRLKLHYGYEEK